MIILQEPYIVPEAALVQLERVASSAKVQIPSKTM